jgi:hypothetical protein
MKKILLSLVILLLGHSGLAHAACGLTMVANNISINWNLNTDYIAVQLQINKSGPNACDFGLGFSKGGSASYLTRQGTDGSKLIRYQLYQDNALSKVLKDFPDITGADDVVQSGFQAGTNMSQTVTYYFQIPPALAQSPTLVGAGTYTDSFTINLYEGSTPTAFNTPVDTKSVSISISVPTMIALSLVSSGGGFQTGATNKNVSFGTLAEGSAQGIDIRVRTNAGFSVSFSSANNGKLAHTDPAKTSTVPYSFYANGALLNMSASASTPVVGLTGSGQTSLSGLAYPLRMVIGTVGTSALGGPHADVITVTATTTE